MASVRTATSAEGRWLRYAPSWPGTPFSLWCPDSQVKCQLLNGIECFEPEQDTFEVLSSLLLHCDNCTYVDIGCNMGIFAAYAASLGAAVRCFEPQSTWTTALQKTAASFPRFEAQQAAVFPLSLQNHEKLVTLSTYNAYRPCGIGRQPMSNDSVTVPRVSLDRDILAGRHVSLLKIDIDSIEGALLHTATDMLEAGTTEIDSILAELGCFHFRTELDPSPKDRAGCVFAALGPSSGQQHPRGGDVHDLWRLQRLGYDVYRLRTHTHQEVFDWRGTDLNRNHSPLHPLYVPMRHVRAMKKVDYLPMQADSTMYDQLIGRMQSVLITRVRLAEVTKAQTKDLELAHVAGALAKLNEGNPAVEERGAGNKGPEASGRTFSGRTARERAGDSA